ncbi:HAD family hydrolase [Candidatus Roizmanbacteria bacterium]|nr:HAD family hydrolase [Candidatus Roizmanbacteria bacterium]
MKKAVFLDRDGVINKEVDNLRDVKQLLLLPHVSEAIKILNRNNFLVIIITNQPVVARGWISEKGLNEIHQELLQRLKKQGAKIDAIYCCPHHPNASLVEYRKDCEDRKPNIGMIKKAGEDFNISLKNSFFIGDSTTDLETAKRAGSKSILLQTGYAGKDGKFKSKADFVVKNLYEAVKLICKL